jgi:hypothetical protein
MSEPGKFKHFLMRSCVEVDLQYPDRLVIEAKGTKISGISIHLEFLQEFQVQEAGKPFMGKAIRIEIEIHGPKFGKIRNRTTKESPNGYIHCIHLLVLTVLAVPITGITRHKNLSSLPSAHVLLFLSYKHSHCVECSWVGCLSLVRPQILQVQPDAQR